jgi:hypothetical protein
VQRQFVLQRAPVRRGSEEALEHIQRQCTGVGMCGMHPNRCVGCTQTDVRDAPKQMCGMHPNRRVAQLCHSPLQAEKSKLTAVCSCLRRCWQWRHSNGRALKARRPGSDLLGTCVFGAPSSIFALLLNTHFHVVAPPGNCNCYQFADAES